ncbi:MAG: CoA transferase [SAR324 cluster bacterium]|nr:CoA transferase [SAR324 cluster bacterium]
MLPLSGLRVISVEQYGAGPFGTTYLADLGADVIKIENPREGGDLGRRVGPYFFGPGDSHFYQSSNRNKRSLALDLQQPGGREVLRDLVRGAGGGPAADGVLNNLRGDQPAKLGLTYHDLKDANRAIVCAHLSAYGREGSRASWPGFDYLMQSETGYLALTGEPDGPPARAGLSIVDFMTGLTAAFALLAGIISARATGTGRDLDVSLFDVALYNLNYLGAWYLNEGHNQGREARSGHPSVVPSQLFRTADGWIFIMCNKERFWGELAVALGHPEWTEHPDFATFAARLEHRERVAAMVEEVLTTRTTAEWLADFAGKVPAAPVNDVAAALDNPLLAERGNILEVPHPERGTIRLLANPVRVPGEAHPARAAPAMGADSEDILRELGYDAKRIAKLREDGVV